MDLKNDEGKVIEQNREKVAFFKDETGKVINGPAIKDLPKIEI